MIYCGSVTIQPVPISRRYGGIHSTECGLVAFRNGKGKWKLHVRPEYLKMSEEERTLLMRSGIDTQFFKTLTSLKDALCQLWRGLREDVVFQQWLSPGTAVSTDNLFFFCHWKDAAIAPCGRKGWTIAQKHFPALSRTDPLTLLLLGAGLEAKQTTFPTLLEARKALALVWHPNLKQQLGL